MVDFFNRISQKWTFTLLAYEVSALMQDADTLCRLRSTKAKRLFLAIAECHQHAWLAYVEDSRVLSDALKRSIRPVLSFTS
jgi:hypothetical protein